jgi:hypothetical protein
MKRAVLILTVVLASALAVQAAPIELVKTVSYGSLPIPTGSPDPTVSVDQFDPSLGTLLSVKLELLSYAVNGSIEFDNESQTGGEVTLLVGGDVTATAPNALTVVTLPRQTHTGSVGADDESGTGNADFAGSDWLPMPNSVTGFDSDSATLTNPALFTPYIGTGQFNVTIVASFVAGYLADISGQTQSTEGNTYGEVKVTYEYIPEPATMALLSLGGLAMLRRRR